VSGEREVLTRVLCEHCGGTGRIPAAPFAGGVQLDQRSATEPCRACDQSGEIRTWVALPELHQLLLASPPTADDPPS
jgi:hypothetical protein